MSDTSYSAAIIVLAVYVAGVCLAMFVYGLSKRRFSGLYWLALLAVFAGPALLDTIFGLPDEAFRGLHSYYVPSATEGVPAAVLFAAGHITVTMIAYALVFGWRSRRREHDVQSENGNASWLTRSRHAVFVFGSVFVVSGLVTLYHRWDLASDWDSFLNQNAAPQYESYFLLASTPLIAILTARGGNARRWAAVVAAASVLIAYFIGIRYYMFPFAGFFVWTLLLESKKSVAWKLRTTVAVAVAAWIALTLWGVIRGFDLRGSPLTVFTQLGTIEYDLGNTLARKLLVGNELGTRLAFYDLMPRLQRLEYHRGFESVSVTLLSTVYPVILRNLGVTLPLNNGKFLYELQSGLIGTGVSSAATIFGDDWLVWGWWGLVVGGAIMGGLLAVGDRIYRRQGTWWLVLGPLWAFQIIFFARRGTDAWLGVMGTSLPLTLLFLLLARALDKWHRGFSRAVASYGSSSRLSLPQLPLAHTDDIADETISNRLPQHPSPSRARR